MKKTKKTVEEPVKPAKPTKPVEKAPDKKIASAPKKDVRPPEVKPSKVDMESLALKKTYDKDKSTCRVTFKLPKTAAPNAKSVFLVGDFNSWDKKATALKPLKNGDYSVTVTLKAPGHYRFRFLIDAHHWENHWCADYYARNAFGGDDSVVTV